MLTIDHYVGHVHGKARGKWTFLASIDGQDWEVACRGRKVERLYRAKREVWHDGVERYALVITVGGGGPIAPEVHPGLVDYARCRLANATR